jgi:putative Mg2+ transporter-C (MgtC) family protein
MGLITVGEAACLDDQPMRFVETFDALALVNSAVCFVAAFIFGTLIGAERQYRQRSAGLRTNVLVAVGAAAFVDFGIRLAGPASTQVMAYVVSGIGFLGAGAIMKEGLNVRGLNTAATLWCSAAVGAAAGAGLVAESALLTLFVIAGNTLLRPLVNRINRIPLDEETGEATYEVRLSTNPRAADEARAALIDLLEKAHYPVADVTTDERGDETVEIVATLVATSVIPKELDAVVEALEKLPGVDHATWESEVLG